MGSAHDIVDQNPIHLTSGLNEISDLSDKEGVRLLFSRYALLKTGKNTFRQEEGLLRHTHCRITGQ